MFLDHEAFKVRLATPVFKVSPAGQAFRALLDEKAIKVYKESLVAMVLRVTEEIKEYPAGPENRVLLAALVHLERLVLAAAKAIKAFQASVAPRDPLVPLAHKVVQETSAHEVKLDAQALLVATEHPAILVSEDPLAPRAIAVSLASLAKLVIEACPDFQGLRASLVFLAGLVLKAQLEELATRVFKALRVLEAPSDPRVTKALQVSRVALV